MEQGDLRHSFDNRGDTSPEQWAVDEVFKRAINEDNMDKNPKAVFTSLVSSIELDDEVWGTLTLLFMLNLASLFAQADDER